MQVLSKYEIIRSGLLAKLDRNFPSYLSAWVDAIELSEQDTHYGYVHSGNSVLVFNNVKFPLLRGSWFCVPGGAKILGGLGIVVSREDYTGMFCIGGQIEEQGRLKYIDGCTDSLLSAPVRKGDPCLNLLYFPEGIDQTAHTHPSDRIGMIMSGKGLCHHGDNEVTDLNAGDVFCIHAEGVHKFSTPHGSHMRVLAYHPDSDFGPTDAFHPMINRTIVDGVSASLIENIRTK